MRRTQGTRILICTSVLLFLQLGHVLCQTPAPAPSLLEDSPVSAPGPVISDTPSPSPLLDAGPSPSPLLDGTPSPSPLFDTAPSSGPSPLLLPPAPSSPSDGESDDLGSPPAPGAPNTELAPDTSSPTELPAPVSKGSKGMSGGAKAGVAFAVIFGVFFVVGGGYIYVTRKANEKRATTGPGRMRF